MSFETIHKHAASQKDKLYIYNIYSKNRNPTKNRIKKKIHSDSVFVSCSHLHRFDYSSWYCRTCFASIFFSLSASLFSCALCRLRKTWTHNFCFFTLYKSEKIINTFVHCIPLAGHSMFLMTKTQSKTTLFTIFPNLFSMRYPSMNIPYFSYYLMWLNFGWIRMFPFRIWQLPYSCTLFRFRRVFQWHTTFIQLWACVFSTLLLVLLFLYVYSGLFVIFFSLSVSFL